MMKSTKIYPLENRQVGGGIIKIAAMISGKKFFMDGKEGDTGKYPPPEKRSKIYGNQGTCLTEYEQSDHSEGGHGMARDVRR